MLYVRALLFCSLSLINSEAFALAGWEIRQSEVSIDKSSKKKAETLKVITIAANRYRLDATPVGEDSDKAVKQLVIFDGESIIVCSTVKDSEKGTCFKGTPENLLNLSMSITQGMVETNVKQMQVKALGKSQQVLGKKCDMFAVTQEIESSMSAGVSITSSLKTKEKLCAASESSGILQPFKDFKFDVKAMKSIYKTDKQLKAAIKYGKLGIVLESTQSVSTNMGGEIAKMVGQKGGSEMTKTIKTKSITKLNVKDSFFRLPKDYTITEFNSKK
jgi:hypothetical protein